MRKIVIFTQGYKDEAYDDYRPIIEKVTDVAEVDEETYKLLNEAQWAFGFKLIEFPTDTKTFVLDTVAKYKTMIEEEHRKERERKEERARVRSENALKQKAKTEEKEKLLLKKLVEKHGMPAS